MDNETTPQPSTGGSTNFQMMQAADAYKRDKPTDTKKIRAKSGISLGSLPAEWHQKIADLCAGTALAAQERATQALATLQRMYGGKKAEAKP